MIDYNVAIVGNGEQTLAKAIQELFGVDTDCTTDTLFHENGVNFTTMIALIPDNITTVAELAKMIFNRHDGVEKIWICHINDGTPAKSDNRFVRYAAMVEGGCGSLSSQGRKHLRKMAALEKEKKIEFVNESDNEFTDISSEATRTYNFGQKGFVKINNPVKLNVSSSGGHRIFSADGQSHYIPSGWIHLAWTAKAGQPNFVK